MIDPINRLVAKLEGLALTVDRQHNLQTLKGETAYVNRGFVLQYSKFIPSKGTTGGCEEIHISIVLYHQNLNSWATCQKQIINDINDVCRAIVCRDGVEYGKEFQVAFEEDVLIRKNEETNYFESEIPLTISSIQGA